jgi:maleate isomerase
VEPVSDQLRQTLAIDGIKTPVFGSFNEAKEANVSRISGPSLIDAAHRLAEQDKSIKGIFLSCTNLRTLEVIAPLEAETGLPVLSSNLVLAWHMVTGTKENLQINAPGRLKN